MKRLSLLFFAFALVTGHARRASGAGPIKVACIGEHTTHSHAFPAMNRESQPVGMQEYPAILQGKLGTGYQVRNFGDCCGTVTQGYNTTGIEVHPFVQGANAGDGPGYNESLAFLPDIVVIGSWGRHDWGKDKPAPLTWSLPKFQQDYDNLVQRYMNLSTHPRIFVSLPIPILNGTDMDNGVSTSAVSAVIKQVAAKYNLPVVDLYAPFQGHIELFKQPPDPEGEGEHVTNAGLGVIADKVYQAMMADVADGGTSLTDASDARADVGVDAGRDAAAGSGGAGGNGGNGGSGGDAGATSTGGSAGTSVGSTGSGGTSATGSATTVGGAGGAATSTTASAGGSMGGSTPPSSAEGCSCRAARSADGAPRWMALVALAALVTTRRKRAASK
jgi:MYXO-CTERM domain-containing protein